MTLRLGSGADELQIPVPFLGVMAGEVQQSPGALHDPGADERGGDCSQPGVGGGTHGECARGVEDRRAPVVIRGVDVAEPEGGPHHDAEEARQPPAAGFGAREEPRGEGVVVERLSQGDAEGGDVRRLGESDGGGGHGA